MIAFLRYRFRVSILMFEERPQKCSGGLSVKVRDLLLQKHLKNKNYCITYIYEFV